MSKPNSGFIHRGVNHKQKEFSRRVGKEVVVSTNAAEGLFGRLKAWVRTKAAKRVSSNSYGGLLAEFLWTASCSARKVDPLADLLQQTLFWQEQHPNREKHDPSLKDSIPEKVVQDFLSVCQAVPPPFELRLNSSNPHLLLRLLLPLLLTGVTARVRLNLSACDPQSGPVSQSKWRPCSKTFCL